MTEAEWLGSTDPQAMLEYLHGKASDRKVRLFACACARRVLYLAEDDRCNQLIEVAERYADGRATAKELTEADKEADDVLFPLEEEKAEAGEELVDDQDLWAARAVEATIWDPRHAPEWVLAAVEEGEAEERAQAHLLRDIFGSLVRPPPHIAPSVLQGNAAP